MKRRWNSLRITALCIVIALAIIGSCQAESSHTVSIEGIGPGPIVARPGDSIEVRVVVHDVTEPPLAGSSLYLNFNPDVISNIACLSTAYRDDSTCEIKAPGKFQIEGYNNFEPYSTGDVEIARLKLDISPTAPAGTTQLSLSGPRPGESVGTTPIWGPFWVAMTATFQGASLSIEGNGTPGCCLNISKTAMPESAEPLTNITFDINLSTACNSSLENVTLMDLLPDGMKYQSSEPQASTVVSNTLTWDNVSPISNSSPLRFRVVAMVEEGVSGVLTNTANATAICNESEISGSASANVMVISPGEVPNIEVIENASPMRIKKGGEVRFDITVTNIGNVSLEDVTVIDTLPACLGFLNSSLEANVSGRKVTWNLDTMQPGSSAEIVLFAEARPCASGVIYNTVEAMGTSPAGTVVTDMTTLKITVGNEGRKFKIAPDKNDDSISIGNDKARAFGSPFFLAKRPVAENSLVILKNQNSGDCVSCCDNASPECRVCQDACPKTNLEMIKAGSRTAEAMGNGDGTNSIKILSNQE